MLSFPTGWRLLSKDSTENPLRWKIKTLYSQTISRYLYFLKPSPTKLLLTCHFLPTSKSIFPVLDFTNRVILVFRLLLPATCQSRNHKIKFLLPCIFHLPIHLSHISSVRPWEWENASIIPRMAWNDARRVSLLRIYSSLKWTLTKK